MCDKMHFKMSFNNDLFINYSDYKYFCHNADRLNSYKFIHIQAFYIMYLSMILWIKPRALNKEEGILYEKLMVYIINVRKLKEDLKKILKAILIINGTAITTFQELWFIFHVIFCYASLSPTGYYDDFW